MHDDFQAYYVSTGRDEVVLTDYSKDPSAWMVPMKHATKSGVVEIPGELYFSIDPLSILRSIPTHTLTSYWAASWTLDDWPPLQYMPDRPNSVCTASLVFSMPSC